MTKFVLISCFIISWSFSFCQISSDTYTWNGTKYLLYSHRLNSNSNPPHSLPDGNWIGLDSSNQVVFTGNYKNGSPDDTLIIFSQEKRLELYVFKIGLPVYHEEYGYSKYSDNTFNWQLKTQTFMSKDTINQYFLGTHLERTRKITFVIPLEEQKAYFPFFRIHEQLLRYWTTMTKYEYNKKGKLIKTEIDVKVENQTSKTKMNK